MIALKFYLSLQFLISSFISLSSSGTLSIKTNLSSLIFESIKALRTKTSPLFNLDFPNDNTLSWFFFFFLIINLYFLIPAFITQFFNPTAELVIPIGITTKEGKAEMETYPVTVEINIRLILLTH